MLLANKNIIVSGIGPGLGIELAVESAREGARYIAVAARTASKLDQAEAAIAEVAPAAKVIKQVTDITDPEQCQRLVEVTRQQAGRIDVLFNSAYNPGTFSEVAEADISEWQAIFDVNVFGTMHLTQAVCPAMKEQGGGAIVMINSMVTRKPLPTQGGYAASKAALTSATAHLARELGRHNIRVNSAYMGWMWGPPVQGFLQYSSEQRGISLDEAIAEVTANIPLGKIPDDADCAKAALFLASDYASVVTGACLDVNGGEYLPY